MDLEILGYDSHFESAFSALGRADLEAGRVVRAERGILRVETAAGLVTAALAGRLLHREVEPEALPVVGDWVALARHGDRAVVMAVLERRSRIARQVAGRQSREQVIAANVDTVFLVCGLDRDFNVRRLERLLVLVRQGGATPLIVLNKLDLVQDLGAKLAHTLAAAPQVDVVAIAALEGIGCERLVPWLGRGKTISLVGSSGAGKSTLVNRLMGRELARTGSVREGDGRGQHTTSHRELFVTGTGTAIIDTPGLREVQLWADGGDLAGAFDDLERLAARCRFSDCRHDREPDCAVRSAVDEGDLDDERLESWRRLAAELAWLDRRRDERASREASRRAGRSYRNIQRAKRRERG